METNKLTLLGKQVPRTHGGDSLKRRTLINMPRLLQETGSLSVFLSFFLSTFLPSSLTSLSLSLLPFFLACFPLFL